MLNASVLAYDATGRIRHTTASPEYWAAGVPFAGPSLLCIDPIAGAVTRFHNGVGYQGAFIGAVVGSVDSYTQGGLGMNAGRMCVSTAAPITHYNAGLPITAAGSLAIAAAAEESLYVNPQLAGGAASGPDFTVNPGQPPTAHTLGFNTVNSRPMPSDPEAWEMNFTGLSGRSYLDYNCFTNNSADIAVGAVVEVSAEVTTVYANVAIPLCMGVFNLSNVTPLTPTLSAPPVGETARIAVRFRVDATPWVARIRMGVGLTTVADMGVIVRKPEMWIISGPVVPPDLGGFSSGFNGGFA